MHLGFAFGASKHDAKLKLLMQSIRRICFRPTPAPRRSLPLPVRSVGHYRLSDDHVEPVRQRWFYQLFWGIAGEGRFFWNRAWHTLQPGDAFLYFPADVHRIERLSECWEYRWFTSDGNNVGLWLQECGIEDRLLAVGDCPSPLFAQLEESVEDNTARGEVRSSELAYAILLAMQTGLGPAVAPKDPLQMIRDEIDAHFMKPEITVEALAARHGLHRSTLFRRFRRSYGVTPVQYLQSRRTQRAMSLLKETSLPILEVAQLSGFSSNVYLCAVIRRATGMSPREFRVRGPA